jgi:uncharacterized protein
MTTSPIHVSASPTDQIRTELLLLRQQVHGITGSLVATRDGLLLTQDVDQHEPTRLAAFACGLLGMADAATQVAGTGSSRETIVHGQDGYVVVYAAGRTAALAVLGGPDLHLGVLHHQVRGALRLIEDLSGEFLGFAGAGAMTPHRGQVPTPPPIPARRRHP